MWSLIPMYKTIWMFEVAPESQDKFEKVYGSKGDWAMLFRKSDAYIGSELFRNINGLSYVTIDSWKSPQDFENFKIKWEKEYHILDHECECLTRAETRIL